MRAPLLLLCSAALLAGCGGDDDEAATSSSSTAPVATAVPAALASCTGADGRGPADAFPAGLLPDPSRVTGPKLALVGKPLRETLLALRANAGKLGLEVEGQDYEGVEAELELAGAAGDVALQLKPATGCRGATRVQRTGG